MSLQLESTRERVRQYLVEVRPSRKVIIARPGSRVGIALHIESKHGLHVCLEVEGLEPSIASYHIIPQQARTPFMSKLELHVSPSAVGVHPFKLVALDLAGTSYGAINLVLVILPHELPMEILDRLQALLAYYKAYGIQYVIWYLLTFYKNRGYHLHGGQSPLRIPEEKEAKQRHNRRPTRKNGEKGNCCEETW